MPCEWSDDQILNAMEAILTGEIFNHYPELGINDLHPSHRKMFGTGAGGRGEIKRPLIMTSSLLQKYCGGPDIPDRLRHHPFIQYDEFGHRFTLTALGAAAEWLLKEAGIRVAQENPVLAYYFEKKGVDGVDYRKVREKIPPYEDSREYLDARIEDAVRDDGEMQAARDLAIIYAPEEVEQSIDDIVCTSAQRSMIRKIGVAMENRDYLAERGVWEFGKFIFVGPPGTGKTSLALAISPLLHMPVLEVRLAMLTSQYLGETSKNIDRVFELARRLAPCILFIDEFDYVAKSRLSDDHGAMKRAVNMLLKNIDRCSLIRNGVLLIAATNHPGILDDAAWRRFDEVVEFPLPDLEMRREILEKIAGRFDHNVDLSLYAERTEGFSGSDLRTMVKEALLVALMRGSRIIDEEDMEAGFVAVSSRELIRGRASTDGDQVSWHR
ncbi:MAG: ATP-binding protein [Methanoculleaceae archaeon]